MPPPTPSPAPAWHKLFRLGIPLAWLQLTSEPKRFLAAVAGITFAVVMMQFQVGLHHALFFTVVRPHLLFNGDLVMVSKNYNFLAECGQFTERRLIQTRADPDVVSVAPVFIGGMLWKNPVNGDQRDVLALASRPGDRAISMPGLPPDPDALKLPDRVLFDALSRPEFGPVSKLLKEKKEVPTEIGSTRVWVDGTFEMGATFAADGNLYMGEMAFRRLLPHVPPGVIHLGLVRLRAGANPNAVANRLRSTLAGDVLVLTRDEYIRKEKAYWARRTPIGFVITASMIVGMIVGAVIIYQILYMDVSDHLAEYATLKAIGFHDAFFSRFILQQAAMLSLSGFIPGVLLTLIMYSLTRQMAHLPIYMTLPRLAGVYALTLLMCCVGGALATRRLRSADPAEVF